MTNVPFRIDPIAHTNLLGGPPDVFFTNGAFALTVGDNGEDAVGVAAIHVRVNVVAAEDCVLSPWTSTGTCATPTGNTIQKEWSGHWCRASPAFATGLVRQTRGFRAVRDARGYGSDCPRVAGPPPPGQPARAVGTVLDKSGNCVGCSMCMLVCVYASGCTC